MTATLLLSQEERVNSPFEATIPVQDLVLTTALREIANRYFSDANFRDGLHSNPADTLAQSEILLTAAEWKTLLTGLEIAAGLDFQVFNEDKACWW